MKLQQPVTGSECKEIGCAKSEEDFMVIRMKNDNAVRPIIFLNSVKTLIKNNTSALSGGRGPG